MGVSWHLSRRHEAAPGFEWLARQAGSSSTLPKSARLVGSVGTTWWTSPQVKPASIEATGAPLEGGNPGIDLEDDLQHLALDHRFPLKLC